MRPNFQCKLHRLHPTSHVGAVAGKLKASGPFHLLKAQDMHLSLGPAPVAA